MSWERFGGLREAIAQLAAQIMYGEDVKQYFTAKRLAAKRLLGRSLARGRRYRAQDLPSNGEIKQALLELVEDIEGDGRMRRLFAMRVAAIEAMAELTPFSPRLIGSVATGHVREGSDIDVHLFAGDPEDVIEHVRRLGWTFEVRRVSIMKQGKVREFTHVEVPDIFTLELTVYPPSEIRIRPRSSTDGKPIVRLRDGAVRALCAREHPDAWKRYLDTGVVASFQEISEMEADDSALAEPDDAGRDEGLDEPHLPAPRGPFEQPPHGIGDGLEEEPEHDQDEDERVHGERQS